MQQSLEWIATYIYFRIFVSLFASFSLRFDYSPKPTNLNNVQSKKGAWTLFQTDIQRLVQWSIRPRDINRIEQFIVQMGIIDITNKYKRETK